MAGGFGKNARITHRPGARLIVEHLHYQLDGWLGDELLESTPCFIVTSALARELDSARLTGILIDDVEVSVSAQFKALRGDLTVPEFRWLKIQPFRITAHSRRRASKR